MMPLEVKSKLGKTIRTTKTYWKTIAKKKHPSVAGMVKEAKLTLTNPDEVRRSRYDNSIYLYYKRLDDTLICVVANSSFK